MATPCIEFSNVRVNLHDSPIEPSWILEGAPHARNALVSRSRDGTASTYIWECTPGCFMWHYRSEETIHFLDGSVILDDGDGPRHYGPGDVIFIPAGAAVHWTVETHVRKLAFFHSQLPRPLARAVAMLRSAKRFLKRAQRRQIKVLGADAALASMG